MNVGRMYFYQKGSYQVWSELELELKSRWSNCRKMIRLQPSAYVLHPLDPFFILIYKGLSTG